MHFDLCLLYVFTRTGKRTLGKSHALRNAKRKHLNSKSVQKGDNWNKYCWSIQGEAIDIVDWLSMLDLQETNLVFKKSDVLDKLLVNGLRHKHLYVTRKTVSVQQVELSTL